MLGHDISYLLEVLNIGDGETEDQMDERLRSEAKGLGLNVDEEEEEERQAKATEDNKLLKLYIPEFPRRSDSIDSGTSQSTGLISHFSDASKDLWNGPRRRSRASLSFRDYDAFLARGVPNGRNSLSFSPLTTPSHSSFSLPLSQPTSPCTSPKKSFRRLRGLSMLKLHNRTISDASALENCPHCPQDVASQRRAVHRLPCGHRLCTQALRNTVKLATEGKTGAVPSCCGRPIPGSLVEDVMTAEEQTALLEKLEQWDEAVSIAPSMDSSRRDSIPAMPQSRPGALNSRSRATSDESHLLTLTSKERKELDKILEREDYRLILTGQNTQRDRFLAWVSNQDNYLTAEHDRLRDEMRRMHEFVLDNLSEEHHLAMADAEDKQVKAESDLREAQQQECRDNATALKHMESYCSGVYSTGEAHNRQINHQDLAELEKARHVRSQLSAKHESQINVLRGEQSRRMRLRAQRQDREQQDVKRQQRQEELELERMCTSERLRFDENVLRKRRKVQWRWELQMAIFAKKVEGEDGTKLSGVRLPTATWSKEKIGLATPEKKTSDGKMGISTGFTVRSNGGFQIGAC